MTTFISSSSHPRLPAPDRYAAFLDRLAAQKAEAERRRRRELLKAWAIYAAFVTVLISLFVAFYWEELT